MNGCQFNKVLYKGNINIDFYLFCLRKDKKLIKYLFINLWYYILSYLFSSKKDIYIIRQFNYLKDVKDINKNLLEFYKKKKINDYFKIDYDLIIDRVPKIFIKNKFKDKKIIGYELDKDYNVKLEKYDKDVSKIGKIENIYLSNRYNLSDLESNRVYVVYNNKMKCLKRRVKINYNVLQFISLIILSMLITCFSFLFTNSYLNLDMFYSYFEVRLFILNWLPILLVMVLLFFITKRVHLSWLFTSIVIFIFGVANQTKVFYRDDVVKFEDLTLLKEALIMGDECGIIIKSYTIVFAILIILILFITKRKLKRLSLKLWKRIIIIIVLLVLIPLGYKTIYSNKDIYNSVGDLSLVNKWIFTRQSQIRGLIYPFIYSVEEGVLKAPDNYDEEKVEKILDSYEYQDMDDDKKVNIIAIMLEAYNDFSKFEEIEFNEDIYKNLHDIQKESISGNLVTNIFGGGTITTERNFLTGYTDFSSFRKNTDSYVWYFKEQGYRTEAMHPIYGAFYNRASVNPCLGFDVYYNYENKYSEMDDGFVDDYVFFDSIIEGYEKSREDGVPYFNFSVTYQNHVPYSKDYYEGKEYYFDNEVLDEGAYNLINQYFSGIKKTNGALRELIDYFDNEEEPVIVIFFGDHKPALGDNASIYHELGINLSLDTIDGFLNYYETPYVIHANDSAKEVFDNSFVGTGDTISPIFLMNELFENMGLKGNEYLQYMSFLKDKVDVINHVYYKEDGNFTLKDDSKYKELVEEYSWVNYYQLKK